MTLPIVEPPYSPLSDVRWRPLAIEPLIARAARLFCDSRLPQALQHLVGVEDWKATLDNGQRDWLEPALIELAHPKGHASITFDLVNYPALKPIVQSQSAGEAEQADTNNAQALRVAIASILIQPVLSVLAATGLGNLRLIRLERISNWEALHNSSRNDIPTIDISFTHETRRHAATVALGTPLLELPERFFAQFYAQTQIFRSPQEHLWLTHVRLPGRLIVGFRTLTISTINRITTGDVILRAAWSDVSSLVTKDDIPTHAAAAWGTPGLLRIHAKVEINGRQLTILKDPYMANDVDTSPGNETLTSDTRDEVINVGELELPIQLEIDTIALPLSEIYALRAGYVLELTDPVESVQVKLVTHGRTIGYAELVNVGDHLGVRILRMVQGNVPAE
ncbi:type III secretion system cytoplasmic ring protein SctQ [Mycetohabitans sp. B8]|uniref:type III secretion system cytoplasmic ring protein SctQ n=1 Tax=Mycetohabitans sp. B8 TaxID=2841845 RepID=UPI001F02704E|nr:type III secretion system cytoplasmic ring protein SctQ [Mycetohabitans sp. B8]MCG1042852.1 type III secretion system cytoplasmic ring protein SctQ [Mycetohabitans sp. B8]